MTSKFVSINRRRIASGTAICRLLTVTFRSQYFIECWGWERYFLGVYDAKSRARLSIRNSEFPEKNDYGSQDWIFILIYEPVFIEALLLTSTMKVIRLRWCAEVVPKVSPCVTNASASGISAFLLSNQDLWWFRRSANYFNAKINKTDVHLSNMRVVVGIRNVIHLNRNIIMSRTLTDDKKVDKVV